MADEIVKLAAYMKELGVEVNVESFESRIKLQKFAYILGILLDKEMYKFEFYIRGPYSRPLAKEYYENKSLFNKDAVHKLSQNEKEVLDRIRPIAVNLSIIELEIIASLLYLEKKKGYNEDTAINELINIKRYLKMEDVVRALNKLKQMMLTKKEEMRLLAVLSNETKPFEDASVCDLARSKNS